MECRTLRQRAFAYPESRAEANQILDHLDECVPCHKWHANQMRELTDQWVSQNPVAITNMRRLVHCHCRNCNECKPLIRALSNKFDDTTAATWLKTMVTRVIYAITQDMLFGFDDPDLQVHLAFKIHQMLEDHTGIQTGYA